MNCMNKHSFHFFSSLCFFFSPSDRLVDSKDVTELMLKHNDCEIVIRKKEALPIPAVSPIVMQHPQAMFPTQPSYPQAIPPPPPASASTAAPAAAPALPPPTAKKGSSSSLPPLKCPMAGTFYQSPAPGEPPFVKVTFPNLVFFLSKFEYFCFLMHNQ